MTYAFKYLITPAYLCCIVFSSTGGTAWADDTTPGNCDPARPGMAALARHPEIYNIHFENDLFNGTDQGYTNGVKLSWVSANLKDYIHDPCLPLWVRRLNQLFESLHRTGYSSRNMVVTIGQSMYTPLDKTRTDVIPDDRPYAGWLYLGLGYNERDAKQMDTVQVNIGMVGPASLARQTQNFIHDLRDIPRFNGWDNQLHDELGIQIIAARRKKVWGSDSRGWPQFDAITHYGGSLGNVATYLNTGFEIRAGEHLPNDFGTSPIRSAGDSNAPLEDAAARRFAAGGWHVFVSADARVVAHDIFLDGNTFVASHSVDKEILVGNVAAGVAWQWRGGQITYAQYVSSKEFTTQTSNPGYGAITLSLEY
jgi:lipid A 3-O-deacylase